VGFLVYSDCLQNTTGSMIELSAVTVYDDSASHENFVVHLKVIAHMIM
jgi:hypothetical protein